MICCERRTAGHEIADEVRSAQSGRNLDSAGEIDNIGIDAFPLQEIFEYRNIAGCDTGVLQAFWPVIVGFFWSCDSESAVTEIQRIDLVE